MIPVRDAAMLIERLQHVRTGAPAFTTNCFAAPEQVREWVRRGVVSAVCIEQCVLMLRRDRGFHHVFHSAASPEALTRGLDELAAERDWTMLAADLVGGRESIDAQASVYAHCGFAQYTVLLRMTRLADRSRDEAYVDPAVEFAKLADGPAILAFLEELLDRFAEQIPELDELLNAVRQQNVLVVREGPALIGVLYYQRLGRTVVLRYWWLAERARGRGTGARLIKTMFRLCRDAQRIVLWVLADNATAIAKYEHYGFRSDGIIDQIVLKKRTA